MAISRKFWLCEQGAFEKWPKYVQILLEMHIRGPLLLIVFTWPGELRSWWPSGM